MNEDVVRAIVSSMRAQVASLEGQIVAIETALGVETPAACSHPEDERVAGNFGQPEICGRCGATV